MVLHPRRLRPRGRPWASGQKASMCGSRAAQWDGLQNPWETQGKIMGNPWRFHDVKWFVWDLLKNGLYLTIYYGFWMGLLIFMMFFLGSVEHIFHWHVDEPWDLGSIFRETQMMSLFFHVWDLLKTWDLLKNNNISWILNGITYIYKGFWMGCYLKTNKDLTIKRNWSLPSRNRNAS